MNLKESFPIVLLITVLLLPSAAGATESVQRSTDEQGTIRINTPSQKEKAEETSGEAKESAPSAKAGQPAEQEAPPGLMPQSRRNRGGPAAAEARRKAFEKAHPNLVPPSGESKPTPAPSADKEPSHSGQPEGKPAPAPR